VLKHYDRTIEMARKSIATKLDYNAYSHTNLVAALALTGHDAEAREALQRYLALPSTASLKTIAEMKADDVSQGDDLRYVEPNERFYARMRKAGMPEK
jgi:adenylate cyclase